MVCKAVIWMGIGDVQGEVGAVDLEHGIGDLEGGRYGMTGGWLGMESSGNIWNGRESYFIHILFGKGDV